MIEDLQRKVLAWAEERGILQNSTPSAQFLKLSSEMGELADNLAKGQDVRDDIGDMVVVLINLAYMQGTSLEECLSMAYDDIKDRTGFLNENGIYVKDV